jgi:hypothetical protein
MSFHDFHLNSTTIIVCHCVHHAIVNGKRLDSVCQTFATLYPINYRDFQDKFASSHSIVWFVCLLVCVDDRQACDCCGTTAYNFGVKYNFWTQNAIRTQFDMQVLDFIKFRFDFPSHMISPRRKPNAKKEAQEKNGKLHANFRLPLQVKFILALNFITHERFVFQIKSNWMAVHCAQSSPGCLTSKYDMNSELDNIMGTRSVRKIS